MVVEGVRRGGYALPVTSTKTTTSVMGAARVAREVASGERGFLPTAAHSPCDGGSNVYARNTTRNEITNHIANTNTVPGEERSTVIKPALTRRTHMSGSALMRECSSRGNHTHGQGLSTVRCTSSLKGSDRRLTWPTVGPESSTCSVGRTNAPG